jgi:cytochrome c556
MRLATLGKPILICVSLLGAHAAHADAPLALRAVMKDLGHHMQVVTDGISREDWELVEKHARLIADHPQPPFTEKARILGFAGSNLGRFRAYDTETHDRAVAVGKAARAGDAHGAIVAFQKLQTSCDDCHSAFRKPFVEYFYGRNGIER